MKPPRSYSFRSIYPRVRTKITPNNFRFIILNPTQRTSKSSPRFLPDKQRQERASTPMHRLPQCHLGNLRVGCQNIYQVNQYDTPLSPRVFKCKTYIKCSQIHKSIQSDNNEISKRKTQFITTKKRGENTIWSDYINKARDTSRSWHLKNTREREIKHSYPRVDYSLLIVVATGMMKMATEDDSPL